MASIETVLAKMRDCDRLIVSDLATRIGEQTNGDQDEIFKVSEDILGWMIELHQASGSNFL